MLKGIAMISLLNQVIKSIKNTLITQHFIAKLPPYQKPLIFTGKKSVMKNELISVGSTQAYVA